MKTATFLLVFVSLVTVSSAQDHVARTQVEKASADYVRAVQAGDVKTLERLQSPAMVYIAANNRRMTREEVHKALQADFGKWSLHDTLIEACQVFGDTAVTTGREQVRTESGSRAGTRAFRRYTNVWQRSGSDWVMISRAVSVVSSQTAGAGKAE